MASPGSPNQAATPVPAVLKPRLHYTRDHTINALAAGNINYGDYAVETTHTRGEFNSFKLSDNETVDLMTAAAMAASKAMCPRPLPKSGSFRLSPAVQTEWRRSDRLIEISSSPVVPTLLEPNNRMQTNLNAKSCRASQTYHLLPCRYIFNLLNIYSPGPPVWYIIYLAPRYTD